LIECVIYLELDVAKTEMLTVRIHDGELHIDVLHERLAVDNYEVIDTSSGDIMHNSTLQLIILDLLLSLHTHSTLTWGIMESIIGVTLWSHIPNILIH
jgi:hypothetical protein